nr:MULTISPECIES: VOC family protein [unclassified Mesorhizobium]
MLNAIHHVALICTDYDRSRRFYVELLGLDLIREVYREERQSWKADLRIGSVQLELFSFPAPVTRPSYPEATGLRHLAFAVANLDPVIMRLEAAGVAVEPIRIDPYTDQRFTFFSDPDGLPLELCEVPQGTGRFRHHAGRGLPAPLHWRRLGSKMPPWKQSDFPNS